jgi:formylglycine-generating enzyme required for sulfatase activity
LLLHEVDKPLALDAQAEAKEKQARRKANAAVALFKMGRPREVWPLLKYSPDPTVRSFLLHRLGPLGADPRTVVQRLVVEDDVTIRRALVLCLGEFGDKAMALPERDALLEKLRNWYRDDPDPGLHAAVEWLLRQWEQDKWLKQMDEKWAKDKPQRERKLDSIRQELAKGKDKANRQWYVNGQGQAMVVIPGPVEFKMGSPREETGRHDNETLHDQRIGRTFAIAAKPVTVEQFLLSCKGGPRVVGASTVGLISSPLGQGPFLAASALIPGRTHDYEPEFTPTVDCPVNRTSWYQAVAYCNWLSEREGIDRDQWCYEPNSEGQYAQGMKLKENYWSLMGYRLPTEAEWEYACRAGAETSRYFGESVELLGKYGVYVGNSDGHSWSVGSKKPNDWGLSDMHGNVWCWCQEKPKDYVQDQVGKALELIEDTLNVNNEDVRLLRGGSFINYPLYLRSARRFDFAPASRSNYQGFRPVRTFQ